MSREPKQRIPCIIRISNLGVHFGKNKFALYTGKYGRWVQANLQEKVTKSQGGGGGCDGLKCYAVVDILLIDSCYRNQNNHPLLGF